MTMTPEAQALIDAALEVSGYPTMGTMPWSRFDHAIQAYRVSRAPKCCPRDGAKDGLYWLIRDEQGKQLSKALWWSASRQDWKYPGCGQIDTPVDLGKYGWTVHSECIFPGEQKPEPTIAEIDSWIAALGLGFHTPASVAWAALRHFKSPKLRAISDAEIMAIAERRNGRNDAQLIGIVRDVETHIRGLDVS